MSLMSQASDGIAEFCWRWCCQGNAGYGVMSLPSLAGDDGAEAMLTVV
jgi:hypothetical protein